MPHWLLHLGALGLFPVAVLDSSVLPLVVPGSTDLLLLGLAVHGGYAPLLVLGAVAGSLVGGYSTWHLGRRGGEAALQKHMPKRLRKSVIRWVEQHPVMAVFIPALLPPPIPLSPFVLACGALGVPRNRFLIVFGAARTLRYSLVAWLAITYGKQMLQIWSGVLQRWSTPLLWGFGTIVAGGICLAYLKLRQLRQFEKEQRQSRRASTLRTT